MILLQKVRTTKIRFAFGDTFLLWRLYDRFRQGRCNAEVWQLDAARKQMRGASLPKMLIIYSVSSMTSRLDRQP